MPACPRCQTPLVPHTVTTDAEQWEIEVDVCERGCGGLWLEAHDFEVDERANLLLDQELVQLNRGRRAVDDAQPAECPAGHGLMHRFDWNNENIHLDTCATCQGRWIDGGEIARIHAEWGVEPLSDREMAGLVNKVEEVGASTRAGWEHLSFGQWLMKRLTLTSFREKR